MVLWWKACCEVIFQNPQRALVLPAFLHLGSTFTSCLIDLYVFQSLPRRHHSVKRSSFIWMNESQCMGCLKENPDVHFKCRCTLKSRLFSLLFVSLLLSSWGSLGGDCFRNVHYNWDVTFKSWVGTHYTLKDSRTVHPCEDKDNSPKIPGKMLEMS